MDLEFGSYRLKRAERLLLGPKGPVELSARSFDILAMLLERPDEVVGKTELFDAIWPGTVVEENTLQVHISALRKALDTGMITTVHGRGYKYAGPKPILAQAANGAGEASNILSIAVLPFNNMSGIPEQDYIGDGIAENIITDLSRFRDLTVIARNSSFAYKGRATRVQDIHRELSVNYILEGSIQRAGDRIRVTAQLVEGASGKHLWAERYDRHVDDLFAVMDEATELIVGTLGTTYGGRLRRAASELMARTGPKTFRAFDHFLQGMEDLNRFTKESVARSIVHFSNAVALEPRYSKAHAKVALAHLSNLWLGWSMDEAGSLAAARDAADAAMRADDAEAWAYWARAGCAMCKHQHDNVLADMHRALELNPNDADVLTDMGLFSTYSGRAEEALGFALKAMRINPHYPEYYAAQLGQIYFDVRQYENAIRTLEGVRTLNTPLMRVYLAASKAAIGHDQAAGAAVDSLLASEPQSTVAYWTSPNVAPYRAVGDREHLASNLRKAGLPE